MLLWFTSTKERKEEDESLLTGKPFFCKRREIRRCSVIQIKAGLILENWHKVGHVSRAPETAVVLIAGGNSFHQIWLSTMEMAQSEQTTPSKRQVTSIDSIEFREWSVSSKISGVSSCLPCLYTSKMQQLKIWKTNPVLHHSALSCYSLVYIFIRIFPWYSELYIFIWKQPFCDSTTYYNANN